MGMAHGIRHGVIFEISKNESNFAFGSYRGAGACTKQFRGYIRREPDQNNELQSRSPNDAWALVFGLN
jgi:hypothetical protein